MSPLNFERQDITASIIPGGLLVFGYLAILGNLESVLYSDSVLIVGVFIVASFITGDILTVITYRANWPPNLFKKTIITIRNEESSINENDRQILENIRKNRGLLQIIWDRIFSFNSSLDNRIDLSHNHREFWELTKNKYGIDDEFSDYAELFRLVSHSLDPLNSRMIRAKSSYIFYRNMSISLATVFLLLVFNVIYEVLMIVGLSRISIPLSLLILLIGILGLSVGAGILWASARSAEQDFVNELISEFYQQEYRADEEGRNRTLSEYE